MTVLYRPARQQDLVQADRLVVSSINDLTERHGFGSPAATSAPNFQSFSLEDDPDGLWIAEENGEILGFAWSWICGPMWFLAQLFVSPGQQGRGIGNELMKRTLQHAEKSNACNKVLITFAFNKVSQGLYIRNGLFPRFLIYNVTVTREHLMGSLQGPVFDCSPLKGDAASMRRMALADQRAMGVSREKHHRYLIRDDKTRGYDLYDGTDWVGYAYIDIAGHIGPVAVMQPQAVATAFRTALHLAAKTDSPQISAFLPGANEPALTTAMESAMQIKSPMLLMSCRDLGNWDQYLPRNPGFM